MSKALLLALLLAATFVAPLPAAAQAGAPKPPRLALVIGNAAYRDAPLPNAAHDAEDMARALDASGFTVLRRDNATLREMHLALREFGDRLGRQSTGLFYFAGHGLQVRGRNYLLPVDADIAREDEVAFAALDLGAVMEKLDSAKNPVNLVILDACRDNPFGTRLVPSARGLAQVEAPPGTLIAFATAPGAGAADGTGRNGLYTGMLLKHLQRPGLAVEEVFRAVRADVRAASRGAQVPWESTSLESAFRFRAAVEPPPAPAKTARAAPPSRVASVRSPPDFRVGDSWTYRVTNLLDQSERRMSLRVAEVTGDEVRYAGGAVSDLLGNFTRTVRGESRVDEYSPSTHQYMFPLKKGSSYRFKAVQRSGERTFDLDERLAIGDEEEIDTPSGRARGVRIEREVRWKQRNSTNAGVNTFTYWYNGAAKRYLVSEQVNTTLDGKVLVKERMELLSHNVK